MDNDRHQIEEIKDKVDIYNLVAKYVKLKPQGKNFGGLCPFHQEKTPSFTVSPDMQIYKCFGCGKAGDIFQFLQEIENIDFVEALERLAKEAGITLEKKKNTNTVYSKIEEMNKYAANYFFKHLKTNTEASEYIKIRNISNEMLKTFGIGYATGQGLKRELQSKMGISNDLLIKSGLFINKNGELREKFFKRIVFPIQSNRGKVIGFSGRILPNNKYGPKYLNSPKTPVFDKGNNVYGIYQSRQDIRKEDLAIFCEGQTDVISAHQNDIKNIIAPLGTAITTDQIKLVGRLTKNILFLFDSDLAGQTALERAFILCSDLDIVPYAATPAPYNDIDELLQEEPELLESIISNKQDAFTQLIINRLKGKNLNKLADHTDFIQYINKILTKISDKTTRDFYLSKASSITGLNIGEHLKRPIQAKQRRNNDSRETNSQVNLEKSYLEVLLSTKPLKIPDNHKFDIFKNKVIISSLEDVKSGINTVKELVDKNNDISDIAITAQSKEDILETTQLDSIYERIKKDQIKEQLRKLRVKLGVAEESNDPEEIKQLLGKISEITIILKTLMK